MKSKPTITRLPFPTLHKKWGDGLWWRYFKLGLLGLVVLVALIIAAGLWLKHFYPNPQQDTLGVKDFAQSIIAGFIGGGIATVISYTRRTTHAKAHYGEELQYFVNHAQQRYELTMDEAGDLLAFDNEFLITIDNFFRYVNTQQEAAMLPRIQRFGAIIIPHEDAYLRITLYWQRGEGFFLAEEKTDNLVKFA